MINELRAQLEIAAGRSEFVIAVICDIRGFSAFSAGRESPDTAMFIKRFYLQLLNQFFPNAKYAKPTGDGLLLVFDYSEETLQAVSESVLTGCFAVLEAFPSMFASDAMINYKTPTDLGFGVARGTACCLFAGDEILDYSGKLLNLAARLSDMARPRGVVVDGSYLLSVVPAALQSRFRTESVYVRGIAEEEPISVLCSQPEVGSLANPVFPVASPQWRLIERRIPVAELRSIKGDYLVPLPAPPKSTKDLITEIGYPIRVGHVAYRNIKGSRIKVAGRDGLVQIPLKEVMAILKQERVPERQTVVFRIQYAPTASSRYPGHGVVEGASRA